MRSEEAGLIDDTTVVLLEEDMYRSDDLPESQSANDCVSVPGGGLDLPVDNVGMGIWQAYRLPLQGEAEYIAERRADDEAETFLEIQAYAMRESFDFWTDPREDMY